ncbi:FAD-dependent thymidylate synthase [Mesorhizobium sp. M0618]|uniref:FAD-dependent thymidylate synthase n=1 Tax=Mesorhizobium sp. M0618 TaxID=2956972 RepID=UPI003335E1B7
MTTISAKTILRSRHAQRPDKILSTLLLRYPRPIHAELMTHRQLSRNAASSRAIPVAKLIQDVMDDPYVPLHWGKNQKGMQANEELTGSDRETAEYIWLSAMEDAVGRAKAINSLSAHKQIVNRLLEPFAHITVLVSATEWSNFRALREHKDAEPHIQILAQEIGKELDREDNIQTLEPGSWHLPFVTGEDATELVTSRIMPDALEDAIKLSVSRCASTSYKTVDGFDMTLEKAIELHDKLVGAAPLHASPAEHVAQADSWEMGAYGSPWTRSDQHGNFVGFRQYRKMLPNECL